MNDKLTRRERLERRAERRRDWAGKAEKKAEASMGTAQRISERFWMGQPILLNHHSGGRALRDQERMHQATRKGLQLKGKAERHERCANEIEAQLEVSIFSDDADAVERLRERIAERESEADRITAIRKAWNKGADVSLEDRVKAAHATGLLASKSELSDFIMAATMSQVSTKLPAFVVSNLRANIRRDKKRLAKMEDET